MTPAVPDPTVEALSEALLRALCVCGGLTKHLAACHMAVERVERIFVAHSAAWSRCPCACCQPGSQGCHCREFAPDEQCDCPPCAAALAARAAAPDALRVRIKALAAVFDHIESHTVRNAQTNAVTGYMLPADKWRAIRSELRDLLEDGAQ